MDNGLLPQMSGLIQPEDALAVALCLRDLPISASGDGMTQFGRALSELNIEILCANTSQAKGRVERAHHTLQDRLVKELRLAGISTIEAANAFLPTFVQTYNARFAKPPASAQDLHRPIAGTNDLDGILCWREQRSVSRQLVINYNRMSSCCVPIRHRRHWPAR
jgi:hypothetical protein